MIANHLDKSSTFNVYFSFVLLKDLIIFNDLSPVTVVAEERMSGEPPPLMEGEGRDLRVLGFNHKQRSVFVHVLMRYISKWTSACVVGRLGNFCCTNTIVLLFIFLFKNPYVNALINFFKTIYGLGGPCAIMKDFPS